MDIEKLILRRDLVSIKRKKIDGLKIQGFVLGASKELVLLQYVYDFHLDGLMILRRDTISNIEVTKTDKFQKKLLISEGLFSEIDFNVAYPLDSWFEFFEFAKLKHKYFIFEEELLTEPSFVIGKIKKTNKNKIKVQYFTGTARWEFDPSVVKLSNLTSCQIANNYLNIYEHYFENIV